jgi:hypothetical protein
MVVSLVERLVKSLDFEQVAVWVFEETVINTKFRVVGWRFRKFDAFLAQILVPVVYILANQGQDDSLRRGGFEMLAKADKPIATGAVDAANALIADKFPVRAGSRKNGQSPTGQRCAGR